MDCLMDAQKSWESLVTNHDSSRECWVPTSPHLITIHIVKAETP